MDENLQYINDNFVSRETVLAKSGVSGPALDGLVDARLVPRACYFPDENGRLRSNLGGVDVALSTSWFHPSAIPAIREMQSLLEAGADAERLAAKARESFTSRYANHVRALHALELVEAEVWREHFADAEKLAGTADSEYGHWLAGTYGLCTRANTPEAVAVKECMVRNIDHLTENGKAVELDFVKRENVVRHIRLYDHVAALFAPFERPKSSRRRLCVDIARRYKLPFHDAIIPA